FFSSRRRHTRSDRDWSSDVCSSDLAYMLFFGGFLLLGGRLGDLFGHRRLFLAGIAVFTLASLAAGLSSSPAILVAARAAQGLGRSEERRVGKEWGWRGGAGRQEQAG